MQPHRFTDGHWGCGRGCRSDCPFLAPVERGRRWMAASTAAVHGTPPPGAIPGWIDLPRCVFRQSVAEHQGNEMRRGCYPPLSLGGVSTASAFESLTEPKSVTKDPAYALLFDCDGVIVLTEELHRKAYNGAFEHFNLKIKGEPVVWTEEYYDVLQVTCVRQWVGGGLLHSLSPPLSTSAQHTTVLS